MIDERALENVLVDARGGGWAPRTTMQADDPWVSRAIARVPVAPSVQLLADIVIPRIASFRVVRRVVGGREGVEGLDATSWWLHSGERPLHMY